MTRTSPIIAGLVAAAVAWAAPVTPALAAGSDSPPAPQTTALGQAQKLLAAKDYSGALPHLQEAVAKSPGSADAWNLMGFAQRKLGDYTSSEASYTKALTIDPEHRGALEYMGELYVQTNRPDKAQALLKRLEAACFFGCEELDALKKAMAGVKASDTGAQPNKW